MKYTMINSAKKLITNSQMRVVLISYTDEFLDVGQFSA